MNAMSYGVDEKLDVKLHHYTILSLAHKFTRLRGITFADSLDAAERRLVKWERPLIVLRDTSLPCFPNLQKFRWWNDKEGSDENALEHVLPDELAVLQALIPRVQGTLQTVTIPSSALPLLDNAPRLEELLVWTDELQPLLTTLPPALHQTSPKLRRFDATDFLSREMQFANKLPADSLPNLEYVDLRVFDLTSGSESPLVGQDHLKRVASFVESHSNLKRVQVLAYNIDTDGTDRSVVLNEVFSFVENCSNPHVQRIILNMHVGYDDTLALVPDIAMEVSNDDVFDWWTHHAQANLSNFVFYLRGWLPSLLYGAYEASVEWTKIEELVDMLTPEHIAGPLKDKDKFALDMEFLGAVVQNGQESIFNKMVKLGAPLSTKTEYHGRDILRGFEIDVDEQNRPGLIAIASSFTLFRHGRDVIHFLLALFPRTHDGQKFLERLFGDVYKGDQLVGALREVMDPEARVLNALVEANAVNASSITSSEELHLEFLKSLHSLEFDLYLASEEASFHEMFEPLTRLGFNVFAKDPHNNNANLAMFYASQGATQAMTGLLNYVTVYHTGVDKSSFQYAQDDAGNTVLHHLLLSLNNKKPPPCYKISSGFSILSTVAELLDKRNNAGQLPLDLIIDVPDFDSIIPRTAPDGQPNRMATALVEHLSLLPDRYNRLKEHCMPLEKPKKTKKTKKNKKTRERALFQ
jgi:hypothetical protein